MNELKRSEVLSFEGGCLTIRTAGHMRNGDGYFAFIEDDIAWEPDDESSKVTAVISIPKSELIELRDFLTRVMAPLDSKKEASDA